MWEEFHFRLVSSVIHTSLEKNLMTILMFDESWSNNWDMLFVFFLQNGYTALAIAKRFGYISVVNTLTTVTTVETTIVTSVSSSSLFCVCFLFFVFFFFGGGGNSNKPLLARQVLNEPNHSESNGEGYSNDCFLTIKICLLSCELNFLIDWTHFKMNFSKDHLLLFLFKLPFILSSYMGYCRFTLKINFYSFYNSVS